MSEEYDLPSSSRELGKLVPILKDTHGNIIDGFHRIEIDPNWATIVIDTVDDAVKLELARLAVNFCRRKIGPDEFKRRITFLIKEGLKPEEISKATGISVATIYRYTPQELKNPVKVAARLGVKENSVITCEQTVKSSDAKFDSVTCPKCQTVLDSDLEYKLHWSHKHYGPVPAPLAQPSNVEEVNPTGFEPAPTTQRPKERKAEVEDQACPCCGSLLTLKDYELVKTEVAIKYGRLVQQKLFPEPEAET